MLLSGVVRKYRPSDDCKTSPYRTTSSNRLGSLSIYSPPRLRRGKQPILLGSRYQNGPGIIEPQRREHDDDLHSRFERGGKGVHSPADRLGFDSARP